MAAVPFTVTIDGHQFIVDTRNLKYSSQEGLKDGVVTSNEPNDSLFNADGAWSRYKYSWHRGAGQVFDDLRDDADPFRFASSSGVDVWTEGQLTLLPAMSSVQSLAAFYEQPVMITSGAYLFAGAGDDMYRSADGTTWVPLTDPGGTVRALGTDGTDLFVATSTGLTRYLGFSGTVTAFATPVTGDTQNVAFVGGRLLIGQGNVLSEVASTGVLTTIKTHRQASFRWTVIIGVGSRIYAGGAAGVYSELYSLTDVGGTLTVSAEASPIPLGEILRNALSYAGIIVLATSKGVRLAQVTADGTITYGPLITVSGGAYSLVADGRFVWVGCHAGITIRLALDEFTDTLLPAWAMDVSKVLGPAEIVNAIARLGDRTFIALRGAAIYRQADTFVTTGTVTSGRIYFGTVEPKYLVNMYATFAALLANETMTILVDPTPGASYAWIENVDGVTSILMGRDGVFPLPLNAGTWFSVGITLAGNGSTTPLFDFWRMRGYPVAPAVTQWIIPLVIARRYIAGAGQGQEFAMATPTEIAAIVALHQSRAPVNLVIGATTVKVRVDAFEFDDMKWNDDGSYYEGTLSVRLVAV